MRLLTLLITLLSFLLHTLATPLPPSPAFPPDTERYPIDRHSLLLHFMTDTTGLENLYPNGWPEWAKFDSRLQFTILMQEGRWQCAAEWTPGVLPGEGVFLPCALRQDGGKGTGVEKREGLSAIEGRGIIEDKTEVQFTLRRWYGLGVRRPEISVMLGIRRNVTLDDESHEIWYGERPLYSSQSGPMFCTLGPPLDGMRCSDLDGPLAINSTRVGGG
ncbi:hypothetical protein BDV96DRAFT_572968 [Lophiotrema nucula]|uniref:Uncharacterized protein n=1 Tax=Lophiotrema nucula TaxID=690887 RepID=A0A6A5ZC77_9PLEO|nr:hypothetical protein BDV96DRAFT_572968 [Lophiotrema nucula]